MSIDEASRHQLIRLLGDAITPEGAVLLMEYLPPVGWADVATRRDLDAAVQVLESRILAVMHQELAAMTRTFVLANTAAVLSAVGLAFAAARFA